MAPVRDARILPFSPAGIPEPEPTRLVMAEAGVDLDPQSDPDSPVWASEVHHSQWWRMAAILVQELASHEFNLDSRNNLPEAISRRLMPAWNTEADADFAGDLQADALHVLDMLEYRQIVRLSRKRVSLPDSAGDIARHLWALWAELFEYHQTGPAWVNPLHKHLGPALQSLVPRSLGLIRAATEFEPTNQAQLLELAMHNLDLDTALADFDVRLPRSEAAFAGKGRPGPVELAWFNQVVANFARPMGLVQIGPGGEIAGTSLLEQL